MWRRADRGRVDRGVTENYGKLLKIEQVTADDAGIYECIARNALGEAKHEFSVGVEGIVVMLKSSLCVCMRERGGQTDTDRQSICKIHNCISIPSFLSVIFFSYVIESKSIVPGGSNSL